MAENKITLGGREFALLPCPSIGLKAIGKNFREIGTGSDAGIDALVTGIYYGIKRGAQDDPTVNREFVEWNIDAANMETMVRAFVEANDLRPAAETSQGEA